jgi:hypothetical protein
MMVFSDTLTPADFVNALEGAQAAGLIGPGVFLAELEEKRTKGNKRARKYTLQLAAAAKMPGDKRRRINSGTHGAGNAWAATWDEWGFFMAEVFARDASAMFGPYEGADDFGNKTKGAYPLPAFVLA